jgi:hypothetical protein
METNQALNVRDLKVIGAAYSNKSRHNYLIMTDGYCGIVTSSSDFVIENQDLFTMKPRTLTTLLKEIEEDMNWSYRLFTGLTSIRPEGFNEPTPAVKVITPPTVSKAPEVKSKPRL